MHKLKPLGERMLLGPGINAMKEKQNNPKRCNYSSSTPISNVNIKNMDNCENSNEKLMFFGAVNSRSKMRNTII